MNPDEIVIHHVQRDGRAHGTQSSLKCICQASGKSFDFMRFRLFFHGPLPPSGNNNKRAAEKWEIRRYIHPQLEQLRKVHPVFSGFGLQMPTRPLFANISPGGPVSVKPIPDVAASISAPKTVEEHNFVPIVRSSLKLGCAMDLLFLRRGDPGSLVTQEGDIDGRIKTLLDGLRMPNINEVKNEPPIGIDPFYSLMEDDLLLTDLTVRTDRLLLPETDTKHEAIVIIDVTLRVMQINSENLGFLGV